MRKGLGLLIMSFFFGLTSLAPALGGEFGIWPGMLGPCVWCSPKVDALPYVKPQKSAYSFFSELKKKNGTVKKVIQKANLGCFIFNMNSNIILGGKERKLGMALENGCSTVISSGVRAGFVDFLLMEPAKHMSITVGLDDLSEDMKARMYAKVYGNGREIGKASCLKVSEPRSFTLDLEGIQRLKFEVGVYIKTPGLKNPVKAVITDAFMW